MQVRLDQRLNVMGMAVLALVTLACVANKPAKTDQAQKDSPPPARVQAMYFAVDVEPLDGTHCGSWGQWDICFGTSAPLARQERCATQSMFERCERSVITPLVCKSAAEGESGCQIIRTSYTNVIGQRQEQCDVARDRSTIFSIRCPARLQLAPADQPAVTAKDLSRQPRQQVELADNRSVPASESDSRKAISAQPAPAAQPEATAGTSTQPARNEGIFTWFKGLF